MKTKHHWEWYVCYDCKYGEGKFYVWDENYNLYDFLWECCPKCGKEHIKYFEDDAYETIPIIEEQ